MSSLLAQYRVLIGSLPIILGGIVFLVLMHPRVKVRTCSFLPYLTGVLWLLTRPVFFLCILLLPGQMESQFTASDATCEGGWVYQATRILAGHLPYKDGFFSNYSILYSYIISIPYRFWHSPNSFVSIFILFDLGCLFLVYAIARRRWSLDLAWDATLAFTLLPMTWYVTVRHSQDEIILAFFALLGTLAWMKKREVLAMILFGIGFCCTKFMFGLVVLPFLLVSRHKIRDAIAFIATLVVINLPFQLMGANVMAPFTNQEGQYGGWGLWRGVLSVFAISDKDPTVYHVAMISMALASILTVYLLWKKKVNPADGACALLLVSIALSPRSFIVYSLAFIPLFAVYAVGRRETMNLVLYSVLGLIGAKFEGAFVQGSVAYRASFGVYAAYVTAMQVYWAMKILRAGESEIEAPIPVEKKPEEMRSAALVGSGR